MRNGIKILSHSGGYFIPKDLSMGDVDVDEAGAKILLLSGPNME
jgi:hypothetical protein